MRQRSALRAPHRPWQQAFFSIAVVMLLVGLTACGQTINVAPLGGSTATAESTHVGTTGGRGTITGDVLASPTCPVERAEDPCPGRPLVNATVTVMTPSGAVVATTATDAQGHFSVQVAPGSYVLHVQAQSGYAGMRQVSQGAVVVTANTTTATHIDVDTGIR